MNKIRLSIFITLLGAWFTYADRATLDPTKTQIALPLAKAPTVDGVIEAGEWDTAGGAAGNFWLIRPDTALEDGVRGGQVGDAGTAPETNEDLSFDVYAGFDAENLYIAVRVRDSLLFSDSAEAGSANGNTWLDDGVEVFIDGDNSNFETRDTSGTNADVSGTGGQFVITVNNAYRDAEAGSPGYGTTAAWYAQTAKTTDANGTEVGYEAEFRISLATLGNPKAGDIIGFTVGVNDDDDGDVSERQVIWVGSPHTEVTYGNLLLGPRSYGAPKVSTAPVPDGVVNAAEYAGAAEIKIDSHSAIFDIPSGDDTFEAIDNGFSAWVVHDADAVYVGIDIIDDQVVNDTAEAGSEDGTTWEDDSVEIFFDADHSREPGRGALEFEGQYVFTANGAWRDAEANNPPFGTDGQWTAATSKTARGYQVEFKIKKSALLNPVDGTVLGFHIAQNDDDGAGRAAQPGWSGRAHSEFTYGDLTLKAAGGPGPSAPLAISRSGRDVVLAWTGTAALERAESLLGPWTAVTGATSPYKIEATGTVGYFRLR